MSSGIAIGPAGIDATARILLGTSPETTTAEWEVRSHRADGALGRLYRRLAELAEAETRTVSARLGRSGTPCRACGTPYGECTDTVLDAWKACCATCSLTDTHNERHAPVNTTDAASPAPYVLMDDLIALRDQVKLLTERVELLEAGQPRVLLRDDLNEKIVDFMRSMPGVKLTALVIAENIGQDNTRVGHRLTTLATQGVIRSEKQDGRTRLYYFPAGA